MYIIACDGSVLEVSSEVSMYIITMLGCVLLPSPPSLGVGDEWAMSGRMEPISSQPNTISLVRYSLVSIL